MTNFLGENLKKLREEKGDTQEVIAKLLSVHKQTISDYETGKSKPKLSYLQILSDYFGVSMDSLTGKKSEDQINEVQEPQEGYEKRNVFVSFSSDDIKKIETMNFNLTETVKTIIAKNLELTNELRDIYKQKLQDKEQIINLMRELHTAREQLKKSG